MKLTSVDQCSFCSNTDGVPNKPKLLIYQSVYSPTVTYSQELWVMTEKTRSWIQAAKMSFLRRDYVTISLGWCGSTLEYSPKNWRKHLREGGGCLCLGCCPHDRGPDKAREDETGRAGVNRFFWPTGKGLDKFESEQVKRRILGRKWPQRTRKIISLKGENMSPYIKELPGRFGVACLTAAIFNSLVRDNEVVPLATDLLHR